MADILLCPFCGDAPVTWDVGEHGKGLMIECVTERCVNPHVSYQRPQDAIAAWNKRTPTPETLQPPRVG